MNSRRSIRFLPFLPILPAFFLAGVAPALAEGIVWEKTIPCPGSWEKYLSPRWSPDGKKLLVTTTAGYGLVILDPRDGRAEKLDTGAGSGFGATWSCDGRQVAYLRPNREAGTMELCLLDVEARQTLLLAATREPVSLPRSSEKGRVQAFVGGRERAWDARGAELPGAAVKAPFARVSEFDLSPDGTRMALACGEGIFLVDLDSGERRSLFPGPEEGEARSPRFSPDGKSLVFISPLDNHNRVVVARLEDGSLLDLGAGFNPRWTPDGRILFCLSEQDRVTEEVKIADLFLADPGGGEPVPLTATPGLLETGFDFSPDGRWIASDDRKGGGILLGRWPER